MANIGTQPALDGTSAGNNPYDFRITPETYTTLDQLVKTTKDFVMPDLVETYGDQGITGFLKLTGAINSGGTSDQIDWWELGRRHQTYSYSNGSGTAALTITNAQSSDLTSNCQLNDVLMETNSGRRFIVQAGGIDADGYP